VLTPWLPLATYGAMTTGNAEQPKRIGGSNRLLTMHEAAAYVGRSYSNFSKRYRAWGIIPHRTGGKMVDGRWRGSTVRFTQRSLDAFIEKHVRAEACRVTRQGENN
jgi:hypothetical protein